MKLVVTWTNIHKHRSTWVGSASQELFHRGKEKVKKNIVELHPTTGKMQEISLL
jgi:hypothetical protein